MDILSFQPEIAERMLVNTEGEQIHPAAQFVKTENGYWLAWHEGLAALLAPDTPPDVPCFWVEGAHDLEELYVEPSASTKKKKAKKPAVDEETEGWFNDD